MPRYLIFLLAASAFAQPTLTLTGPTKPVPYGSTYTITVNLSGSAGINLAALQGTASVSGTPTAVSIQPQIGAADTAAQKNLSTGGASVMTFVTYGVNTTTYADGPVMQIQVSIPIPTAGIADGTTATHSLSNLAGTDNAGNAITMIAGPPINVPLLSPCDINGDGVVDTKDVLAVVTQIITNATPSTVPDLTGDGTVNVVDLQRVINAAVPGGSCRVGK